MRGPERRSPEQTAFEEYLFESLGFQYYCCGKLALMAQQMLVYGVIYHHAVEMFLKARLSRKYSLKHLKDNFGHDLPKLWDAFKSECPGQRLDEFDEMILELDSFEDIRYPDKIIGEGAVITGGWGPVPDNNPDKPPRYELGAAEVDRFMMRFFEVCDVNPKFFSNRLNDDARSALLRNNQFAAEFT